METIVQLDQAVSAVAAALYKAAPAAGWQTFGVVAKYTPDGSVAGHDFSHRRTDGSMDDEFLPGGAQRQAISAATRAHWRMTQDLGLPRWYKMAVSIDPSGRFNVDFEYKDDYQEGDIMQRG